MKRRAEDYVVAMNDQAKLLHVVTQATLGVANICLATRIIRTSDLRAEIDIEGTLWLQLEA